ncbi:hypothetical protein HMPREF1419_00509, partial [Helicobacter pylori GAM263BFi]
AFDLKALRFISPSNLQSISNHSPIIPQSFPITLIHSFQTLKFFSNSKNFKQTLSIACL